MSQIVDSDPTAAFGPAEAGKNRPFLNTSPQANLVGAAVVFVFGLVFIWPWWNRYLGLTNEGWFQVFGTQYLRGRMPYRDFYLYVPPGQALTMSALISLFGNRIVVGEAFGFVAALMFFSALYVWLVRTLSPFWSMVAVITTAAIYLEISAETLGGVHMVSILYPVLAFLAGSFALDHNRQRKWAPLILAGFLSGMSLVTKQTAGVAAIVCLGVLLPVLIAARGRLQDGANAGALFAGGLTIPLAVATAWLAAHGALRNFLLDVFLHGASSKGSLGSLLTRQVVGIAGDHYLRICAALALGTVLLLALFYRPDEKASRASEPVFIAWLIFAFGMLSIALVVAAEHLHFAPQRFGILCHYVPLFIGELGSLVLLVHFGRKFLHRQLSWLEEQYLLASAASFIYAFLSSFSWVTAANILVPAFPFVFAFALSHMRNDRIGRAVQVAALVGVLFSLFALMGLKMQVPYHWADWQESDVRSATVEPTFPELRGIKVTPEMDRFLERVVADIQQNSKPDEPVAEFCCMPLLYLLAHRAPSTFAYVHYIDVTPDDAYRTEVERLVKDPPNVVVTLARSEEELRSDEINFRGGNPSGERALWKALENLGPDYRLADSLLTPLTNKLMQVWVRNPVNKE
jgi:hypothetical protein